MSVFYESLPYKVARSFKKRKQRFKKGKPCCICGKMYSPEEMMVAHKKPASELTDWEALYDIKNWEVRCIYCERMMNIKNGIMEKRKEAENGISQEEQPRCQEEEIHGSVLQDGGEQETEPGKDEKRKS